MCDAFPGSLLLPPQNSVGGTWVGGYALQGTQLYQTGGYTSQGFFLGGWGGGGGADFFS